MGSLNGIVGILHPRGIWGLKRNSSQISVGSTSAGREKQVLEEAGLCMHARTQVCMYVRMYIRINEALDVCVHVYIHMFNHMRSLIIFRHLSCVHVWLCIP